jgi:mono/diheme cytochrome c family protein
MTWTSNRAGPIALALLLGLGQAGCKTRTPGTDEAAPAPVDSGMQTGRVDTAAAPTPDDSTVVARPARDTPPAAAKPGKPADEAAKGGLKVSRLEYEGWRQYSVNCARCHGQDLLPNPVAANLLVSLGSGGSIDSPEKFMQVVSEGRPERGMPAFKSLLTPEQINAIYAYAKGRAEGRIPAGRPDRPEA